MGFVRGSDHEGNTHWNVKNEGSKKYISGRSTTLVDVLLEEDQDLTLISLSNDLFGNNVYYI